jgi:Skp family chaperone for outer membrane proteins
MNPDTPRTDAIEFRHCPPQPKELLKKHQDAYALSRELERELNASQAEVAKLRDELERSKEMVMDAARRGDMMASHWKERAEKAEAIVQQLHHYAGIIEGFRTAINK